MKTKQVIKKPLSVVLSVLMLLSAFTFTLTNADLTAYAQTEISDSVSAASTNPYGLAENISEGAILHAFCWSFNTIKENLPRIAEAGFTSVQTSPINQCLVGGGGGMQLMGNGAWYYHYQPTLYTIGNYQLGTLAEFESMCAEAEDYGIKIIVDVVANHCSSDYNAISSEIKNIEGGAFHEYSGIGDYNNRYQCTQGYLLSLYDLNTQNPNVQQMILSYLKSCVAAGADGFRYDAAKHIELPDDTPVDGHDFASDFWPVVLDNGSEFQYGEILQDSGSRTAAYANYMSVTASSYGSVLRDAVKSNNFSASNLEDYRSDGAPVDKLVTWVESHDNYTGDGTWSQLDNQDIRQAWAVISARGDTTPLFFSRPDGSSTTDPWGKNQIGIAGDDNFCHPEVTAVNHFRNAMTGLPNKLSNPTGDNTLLMIERGTAGAVLVNLSDKAVTLNCSTDVSDGTYQDEVSGTFFTVSNGKLSGTVNAGAIAVIYNSDLALMPTVSISQSGGTFRGALTLTLTARNTTTSTYQIDNYAPVSYVSGDTITIGAGMADNSSVDITLCGKNSEGDEVTKTYTFTKIATPKLDGETTVYFDNSEYNWNQVYLYAYYYGDNGVVQNSGWPGVEMTELGGDIYGYELDESWNYSTAHVIFTNNSGMQYPEGEGYDIVKGDSKIFNGSGLSDYPPEEPEPLPTQTQPTEPSSSEPPVTEPTEPSSSEPPVTEPTEPSSSEPPVTEPTEPSSSEPPVTEPTEPSSSEPPVTEPTEPSSSEPPATKPSEKPDLIIGDVNGDGHLDINDVTYIQMYLAGYKNSFIDESDSTQFEVADFNKDNLIDINDATAIQIKLAAV